jgi:hypothetical protein
MTLFHRERVFEKELTMNGVLTAIRPGFSATTVVRISAGPRDGGTPGVAPATIEVRGPRPIAALLPQVLAKYGLSDASEDRDAQPQTQLDLFA